MSKILSVLTATAIVLCGCSSVKAVVNTNQMSQSSITALSEKSRQSEDIYTIEDLVVLQDFLMCRGTTGNDKNFDLNNDGRWDVFDMCLMRQEVARNMEHDSDIDILVTYFSCTGNTEQIAEYAINYLNADSYEIIPETSYTEDDLKYYTNCRADREQNDSTARPEISGSIENIDDYEVIFVGYPIWHGQAPKIIYTFLESYDFSDKIIVPFCTSASSPVGTSAENLHSLTSESTSWYDGRRFSASSNEKNVIEWIDGLNIKEIEKMMQENFYITANDITFTAEFAENSSADAFRELLAKGDLTINMNDYGNFEKVGELGTTLPRNDEYITTESGDIILYQGNSITIYYDTNTWNFTRLGRINNVTQSELKEILGSGDITVTLSLNPNQ